MKSYELLEAIGEAQDSYVLDAKAAGKKASVSLGLRLAAMVACFSLMIGLGIAGFALLQGDHRAASGEIGKIQPEMALGETDPQSGTGSKLPIVWRQDMGEIGDSGFIEWSGKSILLSLYDALSDEQNKGNLLAVAVGFEMDTGFMHNGKTLDEYAAAADAERMLSEKLAFLLKVGDSLKYGEALYTTGIPMGEKWAKELYDETVETIGPDLIAKYIVDGVFLATQLEADIAHHSENDPCRMAYEEACKAYKQFAVNEAIQILEAQNIPYEKRSETQLIFFITAEDFVVFQLDRADHYGLAAKADDAIDFAEGAENS